SSLRTRSNYLTQLLSMADVRSLELASVELDNLLKDVDYLYRFKLFRETEDIADLIKYVQYVEAQGDARVVRETIALVRRIAADSTDENTSCAIQSTQDAILFLEKNQTEGVEGDG